MLGARNTTQTNAPARSVLSGRGQPLLRGDPRNYAIAKADQVAFSAEATRLGFHPADFALDIVRFPGKRSTLAAAANFAMTVENLRSGGRAT